MLVLTLANYEQAVPTMPVEAHSSYEVWAEAEREAVPQIFVPNICTFISVPMLPLGSEQQGTRS